MAAPPIATHTPHEPAMRGVSGQASTMSKEDQIEYTMQGGLPLCDKLSPGIWFTSFRSLPGQGSHLVSAHKQTQALEVICFPLVSGTPLLGSAWQVSRIVSLQRDPHLKGFSEGTTDIQLGSAGGLRRGSFPHQPQADVAFERLRSVPEAFLVLDFRSHQSGPGVTPHNG